MARVRLGLEYSRSQATRIVAEWVEFLSAGPSPIEDLRFVTGTPKRLFEALRGQTQLERLSVKWGDYEDLSVLEGMSRLSALSLGGASTVRSVEPLSNLATVTELSIESIRRVRDLEPIGSMSGVTDLELGGDWMSPRIAHVDTISFLRRMPQLRHLLLHTVIVDDLDYTPILDLPNLEGVRVMKARGMRPTREELVAATPWEA